MLEILIMPKFSISNELSLRCSANTGHEPHLYSGIQFQNARKILGLGCARNFWHAHPSMTQ